MGEHACSRRKSQSVLAGVIFVAAGFALLLLGASASSAGPTITVADTGDPLVNGDGLAAAIEQARGMNPSAADRIEISVAAGVFDLGWGDPIELPDGVDIVGSGPTLTTICHCGEPPADFEDDLTQPWFRSPGANKIVGIEFPPGPLVTFASSGGELLFNNVVVPPQLEGDPVRSIEDPTYRIGHPMFVDASAGVVTIVESTFGTRALFEARVRQIRATGDASILIEDSTLYGGSSSLVVVASGRVDIVRSSLELYTTYVAGTAVSAVGPANIALRESSVVTDDSPYIATVPFRLERGGSLDIAGSSVVSRSCCYTDHPRIIATDAAITIANSFLDLHRHQSPNVGRIDLSGGSVHLVNTNLDSGAINLSGGASGSMNGGRLIDSAVSVGDASGPFVFDGVDTTLIDDPTVVCGFGNGEPVPAGCAAAAAQSAFGGAAHAVPGLVEAEDYDVADSPGVSFADSDGGNHQGAYRDDDVDIWPTVGESGWTVGRTRGGEWLEYTIDVATPGSYEIGVRLATGFSDPGAVRVTIDGSQVGTIADVPINGWWNFTTERAGVVSLADGEHVLRFDVTGPGQINLDRIAVTAASGAPCGGPAQEGEAGSISGSMQTAGQKLASVAGVPNKYVFDGEDYAEYCVNVATAGRFELDAMVLAVDTRSNSFDVQVNDADPLTWHIPVAFSPSLRTAPGTFTLNAGPNRVRFYHRETGTELDRFEFRSIDPGGADCGGPAQAADGAELSGAMTVTGSSLTSAPDTPNKYVFDGADFAEYCVTAPIAGSYTLSATVVAPDARSDSFYITVGDAGPVTWHIPNAADPQVREVPVSFTLVAGENRVRFHHREFGTRLDSFTFTPVP